MKRHLILAMLRDLLVIALIGGGIVVAFKVLQEVAS